MTVDFLHNKIIAETASESFKRCVNEKIVPLFERIYGSSLTNIQMYEDYIKDSFLKDGYWYYPMSIDLGVGNAVVWVKWDVSRESDFENGIPYAYVGEGDIEFTISDDVPVDFKNALVGRSHYFEGGYVKLNVTADAHGATILAGRYSQTFVDELNRQISDAICRACGVKGLENSTIELNLVFAPGTYMEHTSENVTYRRLLITAKGCTPRDFWIKWTRLNSSVAYSVNDNVSAEDIKFEIGEDVSHKIREKEYRFLVGGNADKYRVAMGRKNITEWRELIKRAIKRGELEKTTGELEARIHSTAVADKLSEVLEKCGFDFSQIVSATASTDSTNAVDDALRAVAFGPENDAVVTDSEETVVVPELEFSDTDSLESVADTVDSSKNDTAEEIVSLFDAAMISANEKSEETVEVTDERDEKFSDITDWIVPSDSSDVRDKNTDDEDIYKQINVDDILEVSDTEENVTEDDDADKADTVTESAEKVDDDSYASVTADDDAVTETDVSSPALEAELANLRESFDAELNTLHVSLEAEKKKSDAERTAREAMANELASVREDLEEQTAGVSALEAKIAELNAELERAQRACALAEAELERMRTEYDKMSMENEKCKQAVRASEDLRLAAEAARREQEKKLTEQLELQEKERTREKMLFAEAARLAKEENDRMASELAAAEAARRAEEEIALAARRREEEKARREAALAAEKERIENEVRRRMEAKEAHHTNAINRAIETIRRMEEEARRAAESRISATAEYVPVFTEAVEVPESVTDLKDTQDASVSENTETVSVAETVTDDAAEKLGDDEAQTESVAKNTSVTAVPVSNNDVKDEEFENLYDDELSAPKYVPVKETYVRERTYMSKKARLIFQNTLDPNMLGTVRDMLEQALTRFGKQDVFIKIKASIEDGNIMILNFVKIPDDEMLLLSDLLKYLGNGGIGITKILIE